MCSRLTLQAIACHEVSATAGGFRVAHAVARSRARSRARDRVRSPATNANGSTSSRAGDRALPPGGARAAAIQGSAPRDRDQPGAEGRVASKARQLAPRQDERVLRDVLGILAPPKRGIRGAEHEPAMRVDQGAECGLVPGPRLVEPALHVRGLPRQRRRVALGEGERQEGGDGARHWSHRRRVQRDGFGRNSKGQ